MRKLLTLSFLLLSIVSFGQSKEALKSIPEVTFLGIDFSHVGIIGADESSDQFIGVFDDINNLMQKEYGKYVSTFAKKTKVKVLGVDLRAVNKVNRDLNREDIQREGTVPPIEGSDINKALSALDLTGLDGYAAILIAEEFNKSTNRGIFELVFFNVDTKEVITHEKLSGKAGGFGLRNYWAKTVYNAIRKIKLSK